MLFMLAVDILFLGCFAMIIREIRTILERGGQARMILFIAIAASGVVGFLYSIVPGNLARTNWSPLLFSVFGLSSVFAFLYEARTVARERNAQQSKGMSFRFGWRVLCVLAGLYMFLVCMDHYWFFRGDPDRVGVAYAGGGLIDGLQLCDDDILVRMESPAAEYRCPLGFVFGRDTKAPFIPWPYDSGRSVELADRIAEMHAEMERTAE